MCQTPPTCCTDAPQLLMFVPPAVGLKPSTDALTGARFSASQRRPFQPLLHTQAPCTHLPLSEQSRLETSVAPLQGQSTVPLSAASSPVACSGTQLGSSLPKQAPLSDTLLWYESANRVKLRQRWAGPDAGSHATQRAAHSSTDSVCPKLHKLASCPAPPFIRLVVFEWSVVPGGVACASTIAASAASSAKAAADRAATISAAAAAAAGRQRQQRQQR
jgi:hypothetical protein